MRKQTSMRSKFKVRSSINLYSSQKLKRSCGYFISALNEATQKEEKLTRKSSLPALVEEKTVRSSIRIRKSVPAVKKGNIVRVDLTGTLTNDPFYNHLFIGNYDGSVKISELREKFIHAIMVVGSDCNPHVFPSIKGGYKRIEIEGENGILNSMTEIEAFLNHMLAKGNVLVACQTGNLKSCAVVAAYLIKKLKTSYSFTIKAIRSNIPQCHVPVELEKQLRILEIRNSS